MEETSRKKILFSMVSIAIDGRAQIELLVKSAKLNFLTDHDVEFVLFTDDLSINIEGIRLIEICCEKNRLIPYYVYQKLLSLNHIDLTKYDYIFVHDIDQIYVNQVTDSDLLVERLCLLEHFTHEKINLLIRGWSDVIDFPQDDLEHTMGNFFGGPSKIIQELVKTATNTYETYKDHKYAMCDFFAIHPDEVVIMKHVSDFGIEPKRMSVSFNSSKPAFLSDMKAANIDENYLNFKLIHGTKSNMELSDIIFKKLI